MLAVLPLSLAAQMHEPYRSYIRPCATVDAAVSAGESPYVVPLGEWTRTEHDGRTSFTSSFVYPAAWLNRQILLRVGSASTGYSVAVGGKSVGRVSHGTEPAEFNITKAAVQGVNELTVTLDSPDEDSPLLKTGVAWLGPTELLCQPTIRVRDASWRTRLDEAGNGILEVAVAVKTEALNPKSCRLSYELTAPDSSRLTAGYRDIRLDMRREDTVRFVAKVPREWLWSPESPSLLTLTLRNRIEGRYAENIALRVGARELEYADGVLRVNGAEVSLRVRTVSPGISADDLAALKSEGVNAVTLRAGEAAGTLCEACDAAGIYVIPQAAVDTSAGGRSLRRGGNPSNDPALTDECLDRVESMFHTSKSHPSVAAYSLGHGIANGINPYESYLLLKRLDGRRPVIYDGAGREWNNDPLDMRIVDPLQ